MPGPETEIHIGTMEIREHACPEKCVFEMEEVKSEVYLDKNNHYSYVSGVEYSKPCKPQPSKAFI